MSGHTRPVLAPGLRVLRRSRALLQIGLAPERRLLLADTEPVRRTLGHLLRGEAVPSDPETADVLATLAPVLVDGATLVTPDVAPGDVAAAAVRDPAHYPDRLRHRERTSVSVSGTFGDAADPRPLLRAAGLRVTDSGTHDPRATRSAALLLRTGEVDRAELDPLVRAGVPHLLVRLVEDTAVVGPFVEPGRTACLRCLDAHRAVDDPLAAGLATQHALARADRADGVAEPVDTALAALAVAWATRDLVTHAEDERPSTWSTTVTLTATLTPVTQTQWLRHPACGCCWLPDVHASSTMGR